MCPQILILLPRFYIEREERYIGCDDKIGCYPWSHLQELDQVMDLVVGGWRGLDP